MVSIYDGGVAIMDKDGHLLGNDQYGNISYMGQVDMSGKEPKKIASATPEPLSLKSFMRVKSINNKNIKLPPMVTSKTNFAGYNAKTEMPTALYTLEPLT